jgi:hypothetical protein
MHMPHRRADDIVGHSRPENNAPRLDYEFDIPPATAFHNGTLSKWYVWIRAQCGSRLWTTGSDIVDSCVVHWGVDGKWKPSDNPSTSASAFVDSKGDVERGTSHESFEEGSYGESWHWVRLGDVTFASSGGLHEINIWGGGSGFRLDKVIITRNSEGPAPVKSYADNAPSFIRETTPSWNDVRGNPYQTYVSDKRYGGPPDTKGRGKDSDACHKCNPMYGQKVNQPGQTPEDLDKSGKIEKDEICDHPLDDIYDDKEPLRSAQEAAKNFVKRMRAPFEQVGFVAYSTNVNPDDFRELNCIETPGRNGSRPPGQGVWDPEDGPDNYWIWCYDERQGNDGYSAPISHRDPNVTHGSIIGVIEKMEASGSTNIADGMLWGLNLLSSTTGHYGRPNATKIMILLTDGIANQYPGCSSWPCDSCKKSVDCCQTDWWDGPPPEDCVIYYANQARDQGVIIYTISLGYAADRDLMKAVAKTTGGVEYFAPTGDQLDAIFQEIADRIFLRLIE